MYQISLQCDKVLVYNEAYQSHDSAKKSKPWLKREKILNEKIQKLTLSAPLLCLLGHLKTVPKFQSTRAHSAKWNFQGSAPGLASSVNTASSPR